MIEKLSIYNAPLDKITSYAYSFMMQAYAVDEEIEHMNPSMPISLHKGDADIEGLMCSISSSTAYACIMREPL